MSGSDGSPGLRPPARWKAYAKYTLAFTGVFLLLWAIWNPDNRVQWVLTGMLALATWGVWLAVDRDAPENRDPLVERRSPVRSFRSEARRDHREDRPR